MGDTGRDKFVRRNSTLEAIESLGASDLLKVKEHVDDDLLSCFLWAAGENAMNQSGWDVDEPKASALTSEIESGNILPQSLPDAAGTDFPSTIRSEPLVAGGGASSSGAGAAGAGAGAGGAAATPVAAAGGAAAAGAGATASGATPKAKRKGPGDDSDSDDDNSDDDDDNMLGPTGLPLTKEGKLLQRMQRKAESARIARLRKKEYVSGLEDQVKELQTELKGLEAKLEATGEAERTAVPASKPGVPTPPALKQESSRELNQMDALLRRPSVERLTPEIQNTIEKFVANKRQRFDQISVYLDGIEEILQPGVPVQMAFGGPAALANANAGAASDGGPLTKRHRRDSSAGTHLMEVLSMELGITKEQTEQLAEWRDAIRKDREILVESEVMIKELRARVQEHILSSHGITDGLRKILTPQQIAKFLMWVEKNQKSMDMLNTFDWELQPSPN